MAALFELFYFAAGTEGWSEGEEFSRLRISSTVALIPP